MGFSRQDEIHMRRAIALSQMGIGLTEPNPLVGAVVVNGVEPLSTGYHSRYGALHAEREALLAKVIPNGTTLYVTLEPCAHYGKTPPCHEIIIEKGVKRVVVGTLDPNPLVSGKGIAALEAAGIEVEVGCLSEEIEWVNRHYLKYIRSDRPYVAVKVAMSADGKMSDSRRQSAWVTSTALREIANDLRGEFSALLVGSETILADAPMLTLRTTDWPQKRLWRVVLDGRGRLLDAPFLKSASELYPILWVTQQRYDTRVLFGEHVKGLAMPRSEDSAQDVKLLLNELKRMGIASLMVEGGGAVIDSFLDGGVVDELVLFIAGTFLGGAESLTPFVSGRAIDRPVRIVKPATVQLDGGWIVRGRL